MKKQNYSDKNTENQRYDDIIALKHYTSPNRTPMSRSDRAAQFAPFSALTGYEDAISETARQVDRKTELAEDALEALNRSLLLIREHPEQKTEVCVTYFQRDAKKAGGKYVTWQGKVREIDEVERVLVTQDKIKIPLGDILDITGDF